MTCIACFIDNENQKALKQKCFGLDRFELKLSKYKELFINEVNDLKSVADCDCNFKNTDTGYVEWTDCFLNEMRKNSIIIESTFDKLISIYISYISESIKIATDKLWDFLNEYDLLDETEGGFSYSTIYYRARLDDGSFNKNDINNFFHVPFTKRELIGNQRFSISGQPMLYLAKSVLVVEKELSTSINKLAFSAFIPFYKDFYSKKYFTIKNTLFNTIVKSLPGIIKSGSQLDYYNCDLTPNKNSIEKDLRKSILSQILTFPVEHKKSFMSEYVMPQMLTTALLEHKYKGIAFPSTKDFSELRSCHTFSDHESNFAIFIDYSPDIPYDINLLKDFMHFTFNGTEKFTFTVSEILDRIELVFKTNRESKKDYFVFPLVSLKLHIEYLEKSTLKGLNYFDTLYGKIELEFYSKVIDLYIQMMK